MSGIAAELIRSEIERKSSDIARLRAEVLELREALKALDSPAGEAAARSTTRPIPANANDAAQAEMLGSIADSAIRQFEAPTTLASGLRMLFRARLQPMSVGEIVDRMNTVMGKPVNRDTLYAQLSAEAKAGRIKQIGGGLYRAMETQKGGATPNEEAAARS
jgi:hypothetical protein